MIEPPAEQVALVVTRAPSTPMPTCIRGSVPHLGLIVDGFAFKTLQVSPGEAEVQARYKSIISNDSPQLMVICLSEAKGVVLFLGIGPAQATIDSRLISVPAVLYLTKVPHKANDVLVEPVLLAMVKTKVRDPLHWQGSFSGAGKDAPTNSRSLEVQELRGGKVCASTVEKNKIAGKKNARLLKAVANKVARCGFPVV